LTSLLTDFCFVIIERERERERGTVMSIVVAHLPVTSSIYLISGALHRIVGGLWGSVSVDV